MAPPKAFAAQNFALATAALALFWLAGAPVWAQPGSVARFEASDMLDIARVPDNSISLSPNGRLVAFVYPDMALDSNVLNRRPSGYIHITALDKGGPKPNILSQGAAHSSFPVWSPDGKWLAYFVQDADHSQLAVWNAKSGKKRRLGVPFTGKPYLAPQWGPKSRHIVFAGAMAAPKTMTSLFLPPPTFTEAAQAPDQAAVPRVVVVKSKDKSIPGDAVFIDHRLAVLAVADVSNGQETALTKAPVHLRSFQVSPKSGQVIYRAPTAKSFGLVGQHVQATWLVSLQGEEKPGLLSANGERLRWNPAGDALLYVQAGAIHTMDMTGRQQGGPEQAKALHVSDFSWSPDGKWLALLVPDRALKDAEIEPKKPGMDSIAQPFMDLYLISAVTGKLRNISAGFTDQVNLPVWSSDGQYLYFKAVNNTTYDEHIFQYDMDQSRLKPLAGGEESFGAMQEHNATLLFSAQQATRPSDMFVIDTAAGTRRRVVALNPQLAKFTFSKPKMFAFFNSDGIRLKALLYRPVNVAAAKKVPVITYVYEKLTPWKNRFMARQQIFLNHGFAVLMPNVLVKVGQTGTSFVNSVVPATAKVRQMSFSNGKFAIWGGSFGAYATSNIITRTDLFACAVSRATPPDLFVNWASGRDRDSRNIESGQARMGGGPYDVMERYLSQSAFFHLDQVHTPVLIFHGAQDSTILFDEGEMMFYALRQLGKKATLVAYTHGDHSLYRHSRADAIDVHQRMLDWFGGCLK